MPSLLLTGTLRRDTALLLWMQRHPAAAWRRMAGPEPVELGALVPERCARHSGRTFLVFTEGSREWELDVRGDETSRFRVDGLPLDPARFPDFTRAAFARRVLKDGLGHLPRVLTAQYILLFWALVEILLRWPLDGSILSAYPVIAAHAPRIVSLARVELLLLGVLAAGTILPPVLYAIQVRFFPPRRMNVLASLTTDALLLFIVGGATDLAAARRIQSASPRLQAVGLRPFSCVVRSQAAACADLNAAYQASASGAR